jgi:hypothetical protein
MSDDCVLVKDRAEYEREKKKEEEEQGEVLRGSGFPVGFRISKANYPLARVVRGF